MPANRLTRQNSIIELASPPPPPQPSHTTKRTKDSTKLVSKQPIVHADVIEISDSEDEIRVPSAKRKSSLELQLEQDVKRLKEENATQKTEIMLLRATPKAGPSNGKISISEVEDSVFCEVCTLKMWTPYILECGHAYCGSCLEDWFNTILNQHKAVHPHYNINQQQYAHAEAFAFGHPHYMHLLGGGISHPKYTCPTCREQVRNPPIEDFNLKKVVRAVARAQGETSPRKEGADSNRRKGKAKLKAPVMRPDPWSKFFRKRD